MLEFGVKDFAPIESFKGVEQPMSGSKPCLYFAGDEWDKSDALEVTKSLLLDFFSGVEAKAVNMSGLDHVITVMILDTEICIRHYRIKYLKGVTKSGNKPLQLHECGPSLSLVPRRTAIASSELRKVALRQPRTTAPVVEKNTSHNAFGETLGRLHMEKQDLNKLQTRKMKGLKRGRHEQDEDGDDEDGDDDE